jgi:hypothetical protein
MERLKSFQADNLVYILLYMCIYIYIYIYIYIRVILVYIMESVYSFGFHTFYEMRNQQTATGLFVLLPQNVLSGTKKNLRFGRTCHQPSLTKIEQLKLGLTCAEILRKSRSFQNSILMVTKKSRLQGLGLGRMYITSQLK